MRKKYWEDVYQCRNFILEQLRVKGFFFFEVDVNTLLNPFQNRIQGNEAIGIACECQGLPTSIYTPYGELNFIKRKIGFMSCTKESIDDFMEELKSQLGLVLMEESVKDGKTILVFSTTKLPWSKRIKELPLLKREKHDLNSDEEIAKAYKRLHKIKRLLPELIIQ